AECALRPRYTNAVRALLAIGGTASPPYADKVRLPVRTRCCPAPTCATPLASRQGVLSSRGSSDTFPRTTEENAPPKSRPPARPRCRSPYACAKFLHASRQADQIGRAHV